MGDFIGPFDDPVLRSKKRLADFVVDSDRRPSSSQITIVPGGPMYRMHMRVASLGAIVATMDGDPETGRLNITGIALTAHELPQES
jgi:hypothetical protein